MGEKIGAQFGTSIGADFQEKTWTFEMPEDFTMVAGKYAIVPLSEFEIEKAKEPQSRISEIPGLGVFDLKKIIQIGELSPFGPRIFRVIYNNGTIDSYEPTRNNMAEISKTIKERNQLIEAWIKYKTQ